MSNNIVYPATGDGGGVWGEITGTLSSQTDLNSALSGKVDTDGDKVLSDNNYTDTDKSRLTTRLGSTILSSQTLSSASWSLVGSYYEYNFADSAIDVNSIVMITPQNASVETVVSAEIQPQTDISAGSVKMYAKNAPTSDITVDITIWGANV